MGDVENSDLNPSELPGIEAVDDRAGDDALQWKPEGQRPAAEDARASGDPIGERSPRRGKFVNWATSASDPEAQAEMKRLAAQFDAEKDAWMRQKRSEAEQAAAKRERSATQCFDEEQGWWLTQATESEEAEAHRHNDLIERQREVLGGLGSGPSDGDIGSGYASTIPSRAIRDIKPPTEPVPPPFFADVDAEAPGRSDTDTAASAAGGADDTADNTEGGATDSAESLGAAVTDSNSTIHPLLTNETWADLSQLAPEMTDSIESLRTLVDELESFTRPMGPDEAVTMLDGIETLNRLAESLSVVTLSVFERVGTPRDYGAKSTRDLVKNRLGVSTREASRRVDLAENLGKRVTTAGESLAPVNPCIAEGLRTGRLSSEQAGVIVRCLGDLPRRATGDEKLEAERILVEKAPSVHVKDIRILFDEILKWLDPDGELPDDSVPREAFSVNLRARKDGTWDLRGRLDAVIGGIMHGLLTSRLQTDEATADGTSNDDALTTDSETPSDGVAPSDGKSLTDGRELPNGGTLPDDRSSTLDEPGGLDPATDEVARLFSEVLRGDRYDAIDPTTTMTTSSGAQQDSSDTGIPAGCGVREDGTPVPMASEQPSVRQRIYERFSTIISRIEMGRVGAGAPFALVVTAKAEDIAKGSGRATTGAAELFPIETAAREGLNGTVFFHLMSEKGRTVGVKTENRCANRSQLTILAARDRGCTFPACETPPGWCDAHHIVPWSQEGRTDINNLTLVCGAHHHLIDKSDWSTVMLVNGHPAWVPPATIDPARRPILHSRFLAQDIADTLFD